MKKHILLFVIFIASSQLSLAQVNPDSLKGIYSGIVYHKYSYVNTWTSFYDPDTQRVTYIDTINCLTNISGTGQFNTTSTFWTDYSYCNGAYNPDSFNITFVTYHRFYALDSLTQFWVIPRPPPDYFRDQYLFLGKRIPGTFNVGVQGLMDYMNISIYPNPATDKLYINSSGSTGNGTITIYNLLGETIYTMDANRKHETVNCKPFSSGIYFLQMKTESGVVTKKFVKE